MTDQNETVPDEMFFWHIGLYDRSPVLADMPHSFMDALTSALHDAGRDEANDDVLACTVVSRFEQAVLIFSRMETPISAFDLARREKDIVHAFSNVAYMAALMNLRMRSARASSAMAEVGLMSSAIATHLTASDPEAPWSDVAHNIRNHLGATVSAWVKRSLHALEGKRLAIGEAERRASEAPT